MFIGTYKAIRGFDTASYDKPLTMVLPTMDETSRLLDIEDAIVTDRALHWGFCNTYFINKLLGGHKKVCAMARCNIPTAKTGCLAPSVEVSITIDHPISIRDISYFVKRATEDGIKMYNDGAYGSFELYVRIETTETDRQRTARQETVKKIGY